MDLQEQDNNKVGGHKAEAVDEDHDGSQRKSQASEKPQLHERLVVAQLGNDETGPGDERDAE